MNALDICERIAVIDVKISNLAAQKSELKIELERVTGMSYHDFLNGMRRLLGPIEEA